MPPGDFERAAAAHEVAVEDVVELFLYRASDPLSGARMFPWLFREANRGRQERLARAKWLMLRVRAEQDPEKREALRAELRKINSPR